MARAIVLILLLSISVAHARAQESAGDLLNTKTGVKYIGTAQCTSCHQEQHASYLKTTHSIAATKTDPESEPEPAEYEHPILGFQYHAERKDGRLIHREVIPAADGQTLVDTEQPIAYTIGSGAHAKSYLFRTGKFFGQSPLTWYHEPNAWRMSPGFEGPFQASFHRKIGSECVFCHVGSIDPLEHNPYQFEIIETTIGCERCHGPGELHAKKYRNNPDAVGDDHTIVNPASLPRELGEAICQQCHLQGANWVTRSGKDVWDFRPGLPLTDFRVDYQFAAGSGMQIVGHVEQMHASECYKQTETMTCVTCHDPHNPIPEEHKIDFYRSVCLNCHKDDSCGTPHDERMERAGNNCYQCHMPKADTNVTHAAFHHHRIGIHSSETKPIAKTQAMLVPILDLSGLTEREQIRCLSIAKVLQLREDPTNIDYDHFGHEATASLIKLRSSGPVDAASESQLARLAIAQNQEAIAVNLAQQSRTKDPRPTLAHIEATALLARIARQNGQMDKAVELYRKVASYHRDANDTFYLGICEMTLGNVAQATAAFEKSLEIDPMQVNPHRALQTIYQQTNRPKQAAVHAEAQQKIIQTMQLLQQKSSPQ